MAIAIGIDCVLCLGDMALSDPPVSGDFNEQGVQEPFCSECGTGFEHEIMENEKAVQSTFVNTISNKRFSDLIHKLYTRSGKKYLNYSEKQEEIQDIRQNCDSRRELIDFLVEKYNENTDFIESQI